MNFSLKCLIFSIIICVARSNNQPEVEIDQGTVRGLYRNSFSNRKIISFEGIPYAQQQTGEDRFKEALPPDPWVGVYNATIEPPQCLQIDFLQNRIRGSEDCLYINVYTPCLPGKVERPKLFNVLVFIHGGAFYRGNSVDHGPYLLLDRELVLVTFNYRLGPLGFLSTEDEVLPGNNGLKDQVLALKWVQKNIAKFGGNPKSVTIGGVSAGAASCHYHTLSPLSKGLFKRAILISGVALNPWALADNSKLKTRKIAQDLGCPTERSQAIIECLRNRPAEHIVSLSRQFMYSGTSFPLAAFGPVIEAPHSKAFISDLPENITRYKRGSDVPLLVSYTYEEGFFRKSGALISKVDVFDDLLKNWDGLLRFVLDFNNTVKCRRKANIGHQIKELYKIDEAAKGNIVQMIEDRLFVAGISKTIRITSLHNSSPVYAYRFSYRGKHSFTEFSNSEDIFGLNQGDDVLFTLGFSNLYNVETGLDLKVSNKILDIWESFCANGTVPGWSNVKQHLPNILFIDITSPTNLQPTIGMELGKEGFWDCLDMDEKVKTAVAKVNRG